MRSTRTVLHADFDGTLFDPGAKIFLSPFYNVQTVKLMNKHDVLFVLNTGRPVWDKFADLQLLATGMRLPDAIVAAAGTVVLWRQNRSFVRDAAWNERIKRTNWDKQRVIETVLPVFKNNNVHLFDTANPYMTRAWIYNRDVAELFRLKKKLESMLPGTKVLLTEQILLPNTNSVFSGYFLFVPSIAGKEKGSFFVNQQLEKKLGSRLKKIYIGDALVDASMLIMDNNANSASYCVHPTPLAKKALGGSKVKLLDGNPPELILNILKSHVHPKGVLTNYRNSPYRKLVTPLESLLNTMVDPKLTPDQISLKGLDHVKQATNSRSRIWLRPVWMLCKGYLFDVLDGIRARKHPELATPEGQLVDVYSDRMKEFLQLSDRKQYDAALSCMLPSIARAQAEAMGATVPEYDPAGGSMLSRTSKLLRSFLWNSLGFKNKSQQLDKKIYEANMGSYTNRKEYAKNFSWSKLKEYDKRSIERLLFLIWLLQKQLENLKKNNVAVNQELVRILREFGEVNIENRSKFEEMLK